MLAAWAFGGTGGTGRCAPELARQRPFSHRRVIFSRQFVQFAGFFGGCGALTRSSMYFDRLLGPRSESIFAQVSFASVIVALDAVLPLGRPAPARRPPRRVGLVMVQGSIHRGQRLGVRKENRAFRPAAAEVVLGAIGAFHEPLAQAAAAGCGPPQRADVLANLLANCKCFHGKATLARLFEFVNEKFKGKDKKNLIRSKALFMRLGGFVAQATNRNVAEATNYFFFFFFGRAGGSSGPKSS
jgi:hypothetical protein